MKLRLWLPLIVILNFISIKASAQKNGVYAVTAFYQRSMAGTIRADQEGSAARNTYLIYIETPAGTHPDWDNIIISGKTYPVQATIIREGKTIAGKESITQKNTIVKAKTSHSLWLIQGTAAGTDDNTASAVSLKGKWKGKPVNYKITKIKELETINYP